MHASQTRLYQAISNIFRDIMMSNKLTGESERQSLCIRLIDGLAKADGFSSLSNKMATLNIHQKLVQLSERKPNSKESKTILDLMDILNGIR
jgi:hypothetical protein